MKFSCDQCSAQYMIADEKVGARGVKVKCKKCANIIVVKPAAAAAETPATANVDGGLGGFAGSFGHAPDPTAAGLASLAAGAAPASDLDLGAFGSAPTAPAATTTRGGEKEWYVAIDDAQVGPIDIAEIERRWDQLEVDEESLAWKTGMSDWQPVAEIPELAYLVTERPQKKSKPAGRAASAGRGGAAFAGGAALAAQAEGGWRPSAASALSSLVQDEMAGQSKPAESSNLASQLGMPSFAASDLFGGGDRKAGSQMAPGFGASAPDPFAGAPAWTVPKPRPTSKIKPVHVVFGGMGLLALGLVGVIALAVVRPGLIPGVGQPPAATPPAPNPAPPVAGIDRAPSNPPDNAKRDEEDAARKAAASARKAAPGKAKETRPAGEETAAPRRPDRKENLDDLFDDKPKKPAGPAPKAALSKDDVMSGFKKNVENIKACLGGAMKAGELVPGQRYVLILDWDIQPSGSVANARLKGPANVLETSLPACFAQKMRQWDFPASQSGAPVRNVPLPFTAPQ